jgi:hypothetical protein
VPGKIIVGLQCLPQVPLKVSIKEPFTDNEVMLVSNAIPTDTIMVFNPILNLPAGDYEVLIEIADEKLSLPFTLLGSIFDFAEVIPSETNGPAVVRFGLTIPAKMPIRATIVNQLGVELIEVYNAIPNGLHEQFQINLTGFNTGIYYIKLEYTNSMSLILPVSVLVMKQ